MLFNLFLVLSIIGGIDTAYLVYKRKKSEAPICPLRGDCSFVLNSKYNKIFGIHTDLIGLAYFIAIPLSAVFFIGLLILGAFQVNPAGIAIALFMLSISFVIATLLAFLITLRMLFIQFFIIKKMCFWCLLSSSCVIGMTIILTLFAFGVSF